MLLLYLSNKKFKRGDFEATGFPTETEQERPKNLSSIKKKLHHQKPISTSETLNYHLKIIITSTCTSPISWHYNYKHAKMGPFLG